MRTVRFPMSFLLVWMMPAFSVPLFAELNPGPNDLYVRVVDNGAGLCTIVEIPDRHYLVYDSGHWQQGHRCRDAAREIIDGGSIDLMIVSHSDGDHVADGDDILHDFAVKQIIRAGTRRDDRAHWKRLNNAVGDEAKKDATVINLQTSTLVPGTQLAVGSATVTLIFGLGDWTATSLSTSESRNAISVVARLDFAGASILLTGDSIGRRLNDPPGACKDAEKIMVDRHRACGPSLDSDVIIAPHHGANNGSSKCFIDEVTPEFVIFSAGHHFRHPTAATAQRYLDHGVAIGKMFRTDRGDDEGAGEWDHLRVAGCSDPKGDDDVEVVVRQSGSILVDYRLASTGC